MLVIGALVATSLMVMPMEKSVAFTGAGGLELYGTLTTPASSAPMPAVLLLPGSGPTDRDGNQRPQVVTDILKQIAENLASAGIASLRFDKRATRLYYSKFPKDRGQWADFFKWENFVGDATAAFRFLQSQSGIDPRRVAILGHSEGAEIALQIGSNLATDPKRPAAIVTIGGAGRPMGPILDEQISRLLELQKALPPVKKQYMEALDKAIAQLIKTGAYPDDILPGLAALFNPTTTKLMYSYLTIDPAVLAKRYPGPVLLVNGAHDTQISPDRDTPLLKAALQSRSSGSVEVLIVPDASHNLKSTKAGSDDAIAGPVDPLALAKIKQFLLRELIH